ncbi:hypothetical protein MJN51_30765, partial [Salmonella enterica subsp. enterica serovar Kentucky]|nr:hypothetical protein [Salmonella enterica subsp. enterica serovar Kentucky]
VLASGPTETTFTAANLEQAFSGVLRHIALSGGEEHIITDDERHISVLQSMRDQLLALAESCPGDDSADCPIIDNLSGCCHHKAQKPR